jgi:hypothetical protein
MTWELSDKRTLRVSMPMKPFPGEVGRTRGEALGGMHGAPPEPAGCHSIGDSNERRVEESDRLRLNELIDHVPRTVPKAKRRSQV